MLLSGYSLHGSLQFFPYLQLLSTRRRPRRDGLESYHAFSSYIYIYRRERSFDERRRWKFDRYSFRLVSTRRKFNFRSPLYTAATTTSNLCHFRHPYSEFRVKYLSGKVFKNICLFLNSSVENRVSQEIAVIRETFLSSTIHTNFMLQWLIHSYNRCRLPFNR